jgi:VIT1/CCC1 family predicted Fe2+/Mn2+ transporter
LIPIFPYLAGVESRASLISMALVIGTIGAIGVYLGKLSRKRFLP